MPKINRKLFSFSFQSNQPKPAGFTLIELLVVITIIGILTGIGVTSFSSAQIKGRDTSRKSDLNTIRLSLEQYFNKNGSYPCATAAGTGACVVGTNYYQVPSSWSALTVSPNNFTTDLPIDPQTANGVCQRYYYGVRVLAGSTKAYQYTLFAKLENTSDAAAGDKTDPSIGLAVSASKTPETVSLPGCGSAPLYNYWVSNP